MNFLKNWRKPLSSEGQNSRRRAKYVSSIQSSTLGIGANYEIAVAVLNDLEYSNQTWVALMGARFCFLQKLWRCW